MLILLLLLPGVSASQVDPAWLASWRQAVQLRPEVLTAHGSIAADDEAGNALRIVGRLVLPDGRNAAGVIVHAYHRDADGLDFGPGDQTTTTWRLQGWAKTDQRGRFTFDTIRPAADHLGREAAHIHFTLISDDYGNQWAPKVFLADDPMITDEQRRRSDRNGKFGTVAVVDYAAAKQSINVRFKLKPTGDF
ncbi:MAG: hypothetical protein AB8B96_15175 [Lysobacterales bacterium]